MIEQIDHIGIAVDSLETSMPFYRDHLRLEFIGIEEVPEQKVRIALFRAGKVKIELLEPTEPDSPIARYLEKKGPGIHHIAFRSDDIASEIAELHQGGVEMIDNQPRCGAHGSKIAFIHPKSSGKILMELCQAGHE